MADANLVNLLKITMVGPHYPIAAGVLGHIKRFIRRGHQSLLGAAVHRKDRDANTDGDVYGHTAGAGDFLGLDGLPDTFSDMHAAGVAGLRQDDGELLPSITGYQIHHPDFLPDQGGHRTQGLVPHQVSVGIVNLLETVQVQHQ